MLFKFPPLSAESGDTQCFASSQSSAYSSSRRIRALLFVRRKPGILLGFSLEGLGLHFLAAHVGLTAKAKIAVSWCDTPASWFCF